MRRITVFITLAALLLALAGCSEFRTAALQSDAVIPGTTQTGPETLARAVYPEMVGHPDPEGTNSVHDQKAWIAWQTSLDAQRKQKSGYADGLEPYLRASLTEFLSGAGNGNRVCAPLNIYMCLAMLAEVTEGESRGQILGFLGEKNIQDLRSRAKALWNAEYRDDGLVTYRMAGSVWLNQYVSYIQQTVDSLAENYYASSFRGQMGSGEYDKALQDWLNGETGDLLRDRVSNLHMDDGSVLALATTIYFKAPWANQFNKDATAPQTFYGAGGEETVDFMHQGYSGTYYWGGGFSAVGFPLTSSGGGMLFLLPEEGKSPEDLLTGEAMDFLLLRDRSGWEQQQALHIRLSVPRFDVTSDLELSKGLKALGVLDVFDGEKSDFSPLTGGMAGVFVSQAEHAVRVMIDEEGCTGAAYTLMLMGGGTAATGETVDFTLDRPFLFAVMGWDGMPIFVGIVNNCY